MWVSTTYAKANKQALLMIWTSAYNLSAIFCSYLGVNGLEKHSQEPGMFKNHWMKISSFFVFIEVE